MLLAMDVGNTQTVLGLFSGDRLVRDWRIRTIREGTADEYGSLIRDLCREEVEKNRGLDGMVISCVVPPLESPLRQMARVYFEVTPIFVTAENLGIPVRYREPRDVGADRVVNALAALQEHVPPLVIVDFGTAVTFDAINAQGEYLGGAIAPGIGISLEALFQRAARLQPVDLKVPPGAVGRSTVESIQSGVLFGYAGLVDTMVRRIAAEIGGGPRVIATGGYAPLMAGVCETFTVVDTRLTLKGLHAAHARLTDR